MNVLAEGATHALLNPAEMFCCRAARPTLPVEGLRDHASLLIIE
jgi:hypothetical protein